MRSVELKVWECQGKGSGQRREMSVQTGSVSSKLAGEATTVSSGAHWLSSGARWLSSGAHWLSFGANGSRWS